MAYKITSLLLVRLRLLLLETVLFAESRAQGVHHGASRCTRHPQGALKGALGRH